MISAIVGVSLLGFILYTLLCWLLPVAMMNYYSHGAISKKDMALSILIGHIFVFVTIWGTWGIAKIATTARH